VESVLLTPVEVLLLVAITLIQHPDDARRDRLPISESGVQVLIEPVLELAPLNRFVVDLDLLVRLPHFNLLLHWEKWLQHNLLSLNQK
jgi:hypothetical protein